MVDKPSEHPDWATDTETDATSGQLNRTAPPSSRQTYGFDRREVPPRQWVNWLFWKVSQWLRWSEYRLDTDERLAAAFFAQEQDTPEMSVAVDPGFIFDGSLTEVAAQYTGTITAPATDDRIDRVVIDQGTGAAGVVTGTEAATPSAPAIPAGKAPCAQVYLTAATTEITDADITDERAYGASRVASAVQADDADTVGGESPSAFADATHASQHEDGGSDPVKALSGDATVGGFPINLVGYQLSSTYYSGISLDVSGQDGNPAGVAWNNDGTKLYMVGTENDNIYEYNCQTAFDVGSASFSKSLDVFGQDSYPEGMSWNNDGTKLYMVCAGNDNIYEYNAGVWTN